MTNLNVPNPWCWLLLLSVVCALAVSGCQSTSEHPNKPEHPTQEHPQKK